MKTRNFTNSNIIIGCICVIVLDVSSTYGQLNCRTPDKENGFCLPYSRCNKYIEHVQSTHPNIFHSYLKQLRCNMDPNIHLCCHEFFIEPASLKGIHPYVSSLHERGFDILASMTSCGDASANRVAFGEEAKLSEFPWMALLEYDVDAPNPYLCGASLITDRYALTAAHCMVGVDNIIAVILGEHNLDTDPDCQRRGRKEVCAPPRERYGVEKLLPHPEYRKGHIGYDIALIKLNRKVEFKKHIKPVCLPITPFSIEPQSRFIIAGWGTTENGHTSRVLQRATVESRNRDFCQMIYRRQRITSHHLCVGGDGPIDSCRGDSGGPLFMPNLFLPSKVRTVQYGVVSFGTRDCSALDKYPGIYTNITEFMPWITRNIID